VYVNAGWDAARCGGHLRLHHDDGTTEDVEPVAGRVVVFKSGTQMHEVLPARHADRYALTLWVEYGESIDPDRVH
jgi:SM-20-related protein